MAWVIQSTQIGMQQITEVSTTQRHPFGSVVEAADSTYGQAEFIYLKGVSGNAAGYWSTYNSDDWTTTLLVPNAIGPVCIAMSATDASTDYGWYMIRGKHPTAYAADVADNGKVYIDTVAGKCDDAVVAGDKVHNAKWASADDTSVSPVVAEVEIAYPFCTDEST